MGTEIGRRKPTPTRTTGALLSHRPYICQVSPTPLVPVQLDANGPTIWCKLEFLNPSGSTKDRIARYILEKGWRQGTVGPDSVVVEASSGSTSIALALACAQFGNRFIAVMPEGVGRERLLMIQAFGGEVKLTPQADGIRGAIAETESMAVDPQVFLTRQFSNPDNAEAHRVGTAREILSQIPAGTVGSVVSGVGTGGSLVGLFRGLDESGCDVLPVLARPVNFSGRSEVECCSFSCRIPGVVESVSELFRDDVLPRLTTIEVHDDVALTTTRALHRRGFPVGPSSGLNYAAASAHTKTLPDDHPPVVTIFPDRMERYFTTELFR